MLESVRVEEIWVSRASLESAALVDIRRSAARRGVRVRVIDDTHRVHAGGLELRALWPPARFAPVSSNRASVVLRIDSGHTCVLLPGDVPASVERTLLPRLTPCDVLKLAHHGSASSSDPAWLDALRPRIAIASAGRRAAPLPHRDVRRRLRARGTEIRETWRAGALRSALHAEAPHVEPFLGP